MSEGRRTRFAAPAALIGGVAVMVAGTFAPWLRSGTVTRDSYRTAGLLQRLLDVRGPADAALNALPLFAVLCATFLALAIVGWRRPAAVVLAVLGAAIACLSIAVLLAPSRPGISVARVGPIITLGGAALTISAAIVSVVVIRADQD